MNFGKGYSQQTYTLEQVLVCAVCEISVNGWVSNKDASNTDRCPPGTQAIVPTKEKVRLLLQTDLDSAKVARKDLVLAAEEISLDLFGDPIKEEVQAAIEWAKNLIGPLGPETTELGKMVSDYEVMISAIAIDGIVGVKQLGTAVSIIQSYRQHNHRQKYFKSEWIGKLHERIERDVTVMSIKESTPPGQWWLVNVKDMDGNVLKWFSNHPPIFAKDSSIRISASVARQEEWKGYKSTKLTRVKVY